MHIKLGHIGSSIVGSCGVWVQPTCALFFPGFLGKDACSYDGNLYPPKLLYFSFTPRFDHVFLSQPIRQKEQAHRSDWGLVQLIRNPASLLL